MTYDDIMKRINKILAERMRIRENDLFGSAGAQQQQEAARRHQEETLRKIRESYPGWLSQQIMGQRPPQEPSEKARQAAETLRQANNTITLGKDDYKVLEEDDEQSSLEVSIVPRKE
jgi:hypothetical protein